MTSVTPAKQLMRFASLVLPKQSSVMVFEATKRSPKLSVVFSTEEGTDEARAIPETDSTRENTESAEKISEGELLLLAVVVPEHITESAAAEMLQYSQLKVTPVECLTRIRQAMESFELSELVAGRQFSMPPIQEILARLYPSEAEGPEEYRNRLKEAIASRGRLTPYSYQEYEEGSEETTIADNLARLNAIKLEFALLPCPVVVAFSAAYKDKTNQNHDTTTDYKPELTRIDTSTIWTLKDTAGGINTARALLEASKEIATNYAQEIESSKDRAAYTRWVLPLTFIFRDYLSKATEHAAVQKNQVNIKIQLNSINWKHMEELLNGEAKVTTDEQKTWTATDNSIMFLLREAKRISSFIGSCW